MQRGAEGGGGEGAHSDMDTPGGSAPHMVCLVLKQTTSMSQARLGHWALGETVGGAGTPAWERGPLPFVWLGEC